MTKRDVAAIWSDNKQVWWRHAVKTSTAVMLAGWLLLLAGCEDKSTTTTGSGSQTSATSGSTDGESAAQPTKSKSKAKKADAYADVNDPAKLLAAWQEQLAEKKWYLDDGNGEFHLDQFAFRYTWKFDQDGALLTVEEHRGPNNEVSPAGRGILYLFVEEVELDWGDAPEFIRNKDGKAGDQAIKSLKDKVIAEAKKKAEESTELVDRTIGFSTTDMGANQSAAYRTLVGSGAEFEGDSVQGNIFDFRATAKFHEDDRVEAKLYVKARQGGSPAGEASGNAADEAAPAAESGSGQ